MIVQLEKDWTSVTFWKGCQKPVFSIKNVATWLGFAKLCLNKLDSWNSVLCTDQSGDV